MRGRLQGDQRNLGVVTFTLAGTVPGMFQFCRVRKVSSCKKEYGAVQHKYPGRLHVEALGTVPKGMSTVWHAMPPSRRLNPSTKGHCHFHPLHQQDLQAGLDLECGTRLSVLNCNVKWCDLMHGCSIQPFKRLQF